MGSLANNPSSTYLPSRNQKTGLAPVHLELHSDATTFDLRNGTRKRRWKNNGSSSDVLDTANPSPLPSSTTQTAVDIATRSTENTKLTGAARASVIASPSSSAPVSKSRSTKKSSPKQGPSVQTTNTENNKAAETPQCGPTADPIKSSRVIENRNSSPVRNEKIPKSSIRRSSSSRSALSLVFDISQNQTISRSNSVSSRSESRQGKYHSECNPIEDPSLKIENRSRIRSATRSRSSISTRPGSEVSLLGRRESVTNLIYSGQSNIDGEEGGLENVYWKKLQVQNSSRSSLLFSRVAMSLKGHNVTPGEFDVKVVEDCSVSRQSKMATPRSSGGSSPSRSRSGFLYQVTTFDKLSKDVPSFVRNYTQKNSKMVTETFILRINYLRRRRQLGEVSSTINIGNSSSHSHNSTNINNTAKRSSPTAS